MDLSQSPEIIETLERYLTEYRPAEEFRSQLDIGYDIHGQSVFLVEIRPVWLVPSRIMRSPYAKATFVAKHNIWKVYWMRANEKWYPYPVQPIAKSLSEFLQLVEDDIAACFKG